MKSEIDPHGSNTCSMSPCQAIGDLFFVGNFGSPKTQISHKYKNNGWWEKKRHPVTNVSAGVHKTGVCAKFQGLSPENGVNIECYINLGRHA